MNLEKLTQDEDDLILVNIFEELVKEKVKDTIQSIEMCQCKKCRMNACAIALNSLPAKYVTTTKGALLSLLAISNLSNQTTIEVEVIKALKIVRSCPLH